MDARPQLGMSSQRPPRLKLPKSGTMPLSLRPKPLTNNFSARLLSHPLLPTACVFSLLCCVNITAYRVIEFMRVTLGH